MITGEIKKFIERQRLGYVATVSPDGTPNLSPKGTIIAWDSKTLAFADIRSPRTVSNLSANPSTEINVVDPILRRGFRFGGTARTITAGDAFESILEHYRSSGIRSSIRAVVLVDVKTVSEITSPLYDLGVSEDEIRSTWRARLLGA